MIDKICIDPGHGGEDNGAAYGYAEEDDTNLAISYLLRCLLREDHFEVIMTREKDVEVKLFQRVSIANMEEVDLFISIHCDAFHNEIVEGMSVHIHPNAGPETKEIAKRIHASLTNRFASHKDRGIKESDFQVLRDTKMPAVLIECEFLSNPETRKFLHEPENQFALAEAITMAI